MKKMKRGRHRGSGTVNAVTPQFVDDVEYLVSVGILYEKKGKTKGRKKSKYLYRREVTKDDKCYSWNSKKRYHLAKVVGHRMVYDPKWCLKDHPHDALWYESIDFDDISKAIKLHSVDAEDEDDDVKVRENGNGKDAEKKEKKMERGDKGKGDNADGDGEDKKGEDLMPQICFGRLQFECEWEDWPDATFESWQSLKNTTPFQEYCEAQSWSPKREWKTTLSQTPEHKVKEIMTNMAIYSPPSVRKALKQLVLKCMDTW